MYKYVQITTPPYAQQDSIIDQLNTSNMPNSFAATTNSLYVSREWYANPISKINDESKFDMLVDNSLLILDLAPKLTHQESIIQVVEILILGKDDV